MSGVLHTDSEKFSDTSSYVGEAGVVTRKNLFDELKITQDLLEAYAYALARERDFYHLYTNANTYEDFLAEIRKLFAGAKGDAEKIKSLSNFNLSSYIPKDWSKKSTTKVTLIIEGNPLELDLSKFNINGTNIQTTVESGEKLYVQLNENTVKDMKAFLVDWIGEAKMGRQNEHISKKSISISSNFKKMDSTVDKNLIEWIRKNWRDNQVTQEVLKSIGLNFEISDAQMTVKDLQKDIQPFAKYTKTGANESLSIRDELKTEQGKARLQSTLNDIKHFVLDVCLQVNNGFVYDNGRGNILKKAATYAWSSVEEKIMSGIESFWLEGRNLSKGLLGAGGEFQVKLISAYLSMVTGKGALASIIGGIIQDGRAEPRTDVQIISALGGDMGSVVAGIQVKNVNDNTASHLGVSSDLELIAPNLPDGLRDTLANVMFNSDIKSMVNDAQELLEKYLTTYFWKSLNLHVGEGLNPNHTNTFYFVSGTKLVPASIMIRQMISSAGGSLEPDFTIGSLTSPKYGDEYFASRPGGDKSGEKPYFLEYWKAGRYLGFGQGATDFEETEENESLYNKLLKGVSVNAEINMTGIISSYVGFMGPMDIFPH